MGISTNTLIRKFWPKRVLFNRLKESIDSFMGEFVISRTQKDGDVNKVGSERIVGTVGIGRQVRHSGGQVFVANDFISPFNTQTMHIKSFYVYTTALLSLKTLYPGGI
jgi:hypothetical protein